MNDRCIFDSDRVIVIPFERHFAAKDQDLSLTEKLTTPDSLSGIFNWLIEGLKKLRKEGLVLPLSIQEATNAYQRATLGLGDFVNGYTQKNVLTGYRLKDNAMEVQNEVQDEENEIVVDILNEEKDELKDEYNIENNNGWGFDF